MVNIWLTDRRARGVRRAAVADADCPTLIRIVRLLTGAAGRHGNGGNRVADHVAGRVGGYNRKCEFIAALDARRQARVNQVGRRGRRDRASPGGTQIRNGVGKPASSCFLLSRFGSAARYSARYNLLSLLTNPGHRSGKLWSACGLAG